MFTNFEPCYSDYCLSLTETASTGQLFTGSLQPSMPVQCDTCITVNTKAVLANILTRWKLALPDYQCKAVGHGRGFFCAANFLGKEFKTDDIFPRRKFAEQRVAALILDTIQDQEDEPKAAIAKRAAELNVSPPVYNFIPVDGGKYQCTAFFIGKEFRMEESFSSQAGAELQVARYIRYYLESPTPVAPEVSQQNPGTDMRTYGMVKETSGMKPTEMMPGQGQVPVNNSSQLSFGIGPPPVNNSNQVTFGIGPPPVNNSSQFSVGIGPLPVNSSNQVSVGIGVPPTGSTSSLFTSGLQSRNSAPQHGSFVSPSRSDGHPVPGQSTVPIPQMSNPYMQAPRPPIPAQDSRVGVMGLSPQMMPGQSPHHRLPSLLDLPLIKKPSHTQYASSPQSSGSHSRRSPQRRHSESRGSTHRRRSTSPPTSPSGNRRPNIEINVIPSSKISPSESLTPKTVFLEMNYKNYLQEYLQQRGIRGPKYETRIKGT